MRAVVIIAAIGLFLPSEIHAEKLKLTRVTARWCDPCKVIDRALVAKGPLSFYSWLHSNFDVRPNVDADRNRDFLISHNVKTIPTIIITDHSGNEVGRVTGLTPRVSAVAQIQHLKTDLIREASKHKTRKEKGGVYLLKSGKTIASCVAIRTVDKRQHFLTISHVIEEGTVAVTVDGVSYQVEIVDSWESRPENVVLLRSNGPVQGIRSYPVAEYATKRGEKAYLLGFPYGEFRESSVTVRNSNDGGYVTDKSFVDSGASGGALLDAKGHLIGIIYGVDDVRQTSLSVSIHNDAYSSLRKCKWVCGQYGCYPQYCVPSQAPIIYESSRPPRSPPEISKEEIRETIIEWLEKNRGSLKGPPGPQGIPGLSGRNGIDGRDGESSSPLDLAPLWAEIEALKSHKRKVFAIDGKTKNILDVEEYGLNEPFVIEYPLGLKKADSND